MKPAYQKQKGTGTLFSHRELHLRLQAIKLLPSLTYPLKKIEGHSTTHTCLSHHLLLKNIRHCVRLSGCCRRGWHLKLKHLKLLLESGNHHCPLLKVKIFLLNMVLKVYNHVGALVHHHESGV
jgi:hypothetical protein